MFDTLVVQSCVYIMHALVPFIVSYVNMHFNIVLCCDTKHLPTNGMLYLLLYKVMGVSVILLMQHAPSHCSLLRYIKWALFDSKFWDHCCDILSLVM